MEVIKQKMSQDSSSQNDRKASGSSDGVQMSENYSVFKALTYAKWQIL